MTEMNAQKWQVWVKWADGKEAVKLGKPQTQLRAMGNLRRLMRNPQAEDAWMDDGTGPVRG